MLSEVINKITTGAETYDLNFDFAEVTAIQGNGLLTCKMLQRIGVYEDCLILGEFYSPAKSDQGIIIFAGKQKYPCFYPFKSGAEISNTEEVMFSIKTGDTVTDFKNVSQEFKNKVIEIANIVGIDSNWLFILMYFESAFNPQAVNSSSGATGLIQWLNPRPAEIGTTLEALRNMTALEQLEFVKKDFIRATGRLKNIFDTFMWVFYPAYVGESPDKLFPQNVISANNGIKSPRDYTDRAILKAKTSGYTSDVGGKIKINKENLELENISK